MNDQEIVRILNEVLITERKVNMDESKMETMMNAFFRKEKRIVITDGEDNLNFQLNVPEPFAIPTMADALVQLMAGCIQNGILSRAVCMEVLEGMPEALEKRIGQVEGTRMVMTRREKAE